MCAFTILACTVFCSFFYLTHCRAVFIALLLIYCICIYLNILYCSVLYLLHHQCKESIYWLLIVRCSRHVDQLADVVTRLDLNHNLSPVRHDVDSSHHFTTGVGCCCCCLWFLFDPPTEIISRIFPRYSPTGWLSGIVVRAPDL